MHGLCLTAIEMIGGLFPKFGTI